MRDQLRMIVCGVVILIIAVASIAEPPGTVQSIGYAVVIVAMMIVIQRERKRLRGE
jgi:EamA domain-containing membrane protein RarD